MISEDSISETDQQIQTFLKNLTNALTTRKAKNIEGEGLGQISKMPMELLLNSDKRVLISGASVHCKRKQFVNVAALTETPFEYRSAP
ncbi:hypothetical protein L5515_018755 [Caenorhabditis briggsae]|uniref:Uncharacterized protein n=1 Tax=Caenorhabditis briggsae TaxID=6238 RepID=A0AAE9FHP3_CAEBR|nr:hypothetical protein L5515_018755 [Caenorhabditis briggsae]